jgi:hypothetical protein
MTSQRFTWGGLCLFALAGLASAAQAAVAKDSYAPGTRSGPFVATDRSLSDLAQDGYEIRGNLGTALVLQKGASIYSCMIPPDPEHLSYRTYFVCSELKEMHEGRMPQAPRQTLPELKMEQPKLKMEKP